MQLKLLSDRSAELLEDRGIWLLVRVEGNRGATWIRRDRVKRARKTA